MANGSSSFRGTPISMARTWPRYGGSGGLNQALLGRDEGGRGASFDGQAQGKPAIGVEAGGEVERQDGFSRAVHRFDHQAQGALDVASQAGAEQGVDDPVGPGEQVIESGWVEVCRGGTPGRGPRGRGWRAGSRHRAKGGDWSVNQRSRT